jgi:tyrosyl-tRNA synthetase
VNANIEQQLALFREATVDLVSEPELREKLAIGRPLRIKFGCDPSSPNLHVGHSVPLELLRELQDFGHTIIFLIGDFTGMIGDPTGRSRTRPALTREEVSANAVTYREQVGAVLDTKRVETRFNSEWMDEFRAADVLRLMATTSVARILEREDFSRRHRENVSIALHEFLYPLVQAYDSVALEADVELGGTDQLFNLLLGREVQRAYGQPPQIVLTTPLLVGTDGVEKMSKSLGNAIGVSDAPEDMYGKTMSIPDGALPEWVKLLARSNTGLRQAVASLGDGGNPRDVKAGLARHLVARFHGEAAAQAAEAHFDHVIRRGGVPDELPEIVVGTEGAPSVALLAVLVRGGLAASKGEARRLVQQGGVRLDGSAIRELDRTLSPGEYVLQVGKLRWARLVVRG